MLGFILRRVAVSVPLIVGTSLLVFMLVSSAADPLAQLREQPDISDEVIEARRLELHLDEPVTARYMRWLGNALQGDLGRSTEGREVGSLIWARSQVTLRMMTLAILLALVIALGAGLRSALRARGRLDVGRVLSYLVLAAPAFWLAGVLKEGAIWVNRLVGTRVISTIGEVEPGLSGGWLNRLGDHLAHLVLPTVTLLVAPAAVWSRYLRASMLDVLSSDYIRTAQAKGLSQLRVVLQHALPNALAPFLALVALNFGHLLGGAVVIERVFAWQGMGQLLLDGIHGADVNVVTAWLVVTATMIFTFNLLADLAYAWLDPRVRVS